MDARAVTDLAGMIAVLAVWYAGGDTDRAARWAALSPALRSRDGLMSCPCGRGDYDLCRNCPYTWCSRHGVDSL